MGGFYGLKVAPLAGFSAMVLLCPATEDVVLSAIADSEKGDAGAVTPTDAGAAPRETNASPRWNTQRLRSYFERQDSRTLAAQVDCPVLLIHAREDEVVPFNHSLLLTEHMRTETTLLALDGGTHTTAQHDPRVHHYSMAWLAEKLMH